MTRNQHEVVYIHMALLNHNYTHLIKKPFDWLNCCQWCFGENCFVFLESVTWSAFQCCQNVSAIMSLLNQSLLSFFLQDCCCLPALQCFRANFNLKFQATERRHMRFYKSLLNPLTVRTVTTQVQRQLRCPKLFWQLSSFHPFQERGLCDSQSSNVSRKLQYMYKTVLFCKTGNVSKCWPCCLFGFLELVHLPRLPCASKGKRPGVLQQIGVSYSKGKEQFCVSMKCFRSN